MGYQERRIWSDQFNLQLKRILAPTLIRDATPEEDKKCATDMVFETEAVRISCRVRVHNKQAFDRFGGQFTLRTKTTFGPSELDKIRRGDVDLLLYCWGNGETRRIREWFLIDLRVFIKWVDERVASGRPHRADGGDNGDGTSWSAWWIDHLPSEALVASGVGLQLHEDCLDIA